ncbi:hypothetical protein [Paraburkholderia sp. 32]|uniref:hypothetical protein n=1 Tax=Paraburkholderia sp. 32 TaxID=2991057 RepID=UPI003D1AF677
MKRTFVAERLLVGHRPEPTFADQIGAAVAYRVADFYKLASANVSFYGDLYVKPFLIT